MQKNTGNTVWVLIAAIIVLSLCSLSVVANAQPGLQERRLCFGEVNYCVGGRVLQYWEANGGLYVFGYPIGPQFEEIIEGKRVQVQWFERARIELHPNNSSPYDVLLGRIGVELLERRGTPWNPYLSGTARPGCRFFPETGYSVCGKFLRTWRENGLELDGIPGKSEAENLALFGLPISDVRSEMLSDGKVYSVQWFERARFELHLENDYPYDVLLGLLGLEMLQPLTPTPTVTVTAVPPTPSPTRRPRREPTDTVLTSTPVQPYPYPPPPYPTYPTVPATATIPSYPMPATVPPTTLPTISPTMPPTFTALPQPDP